MGPASEGERDGAAAAAKRALRRLGITPRVRGLWAGIKAAHGELRFQRFREGLDRAAASKEITAVIYTFEPSNLFDRCLASVEGQDLPPARIEVVRDTAPYSKALQEGLDRVKTPFFVSGDDVEWRLYDNGTLEENLYAVPHDSLVVIGAAGHRLITELVFGSKLEAIQATLPNPLVVVGPDCRTPWDRLPEDGR